MKKVKKKGRQEGKQEEKIEIAKNLLEILDDQTIALKTDLPIARITALRLEN